MTDKLKAILEEMGASGVEVDDYGIYFDYGGKSVHISGGIESYEYPVVDIDITEGGG